MRQIFKCYWLKLYRRHVKKIIFGGICLGFALIVLQTDELFSGNKNLKVFIYSKAFSFLNDTNNYHKKDFLWMEEMTQRMEKRRKKLQENCELLGLNVRGKDVLHQPNVWEFLVNRPFHIVWCNIFKAASTSWMYNFNILAGYSHEFLNQAKEVPLELARKKYPRPSLEVLEAALNDSLSFLIVRHPFERLLSGFRDKIQNAHPNSLHQKVGNIIVQKYGEKDSKKIWRFFNLNYFNKKRRPTFSEFVSYVINEYRLTRYIDMHWTPITNFCTPCQVRFDIIMKFETLDDDQNYLIKKTNLEDKIQPQWKNPGKGKRSTSLIDKYYSQLNSTQIYELYKLYKYDFQLFGYKLHDYLKYLKLNETMMNELKASL